MRQVTFRGDRMRVWRKLRQMTQGALAAQTGVSRPQIANIETGITEPSLAVLVEIAMALDVTTDWLLDLTSTPSASIDAAGLDWENMLAMENQISAARSKLSKALREMPKHAWDE